MLVGKFLHCLKYIYIYIYIYINYIFHTGKNGHVATLNFDL